MGIFHRFRYKTVSESNLIKLVFLSLNTVCRQTIFKDVFVLHGSFGTFNLRSFLSHWFFYNEIRNNHTSGIF